ncbi:helix-turn-helix transcriptional regulator [Rhodococcus globerulus]|uniref:helix-turn-helix transcriptional regulator n=1 Tax=Rhodococcus globerulus TaxID=33008 RepID=UPI001C5A211A|nr:hypothetical protein [Rhodococcus globerulus]QXW00769.1 hypothetical protein KYT97_20550 [Rhodococcus globerulus]
MLESALGARLLLSKPDIAALAKVQRPVVTMWIARNKSAMFPFPSPVAGGQGNEVFDAAEVVEWISRRGLGNNDSLHEDLAMYAALEHESDLDADTVFDGLTALLCLKSTLDCQLDELSSADLLDEVDELDPDDEYMYSEIEAFGEQLATFAWFVDRMTDASFGPVRAFETLVAQKLRRRKSSFSETALTQSALNLVARVGASLVEDERTRFVDPSTGGSDLMVALRRALPETMSPVALYSGADTAESRMKLRRLAVHEWHSQKVDHDGFDQDFTVPGPALFLAQYPSPTAVAYSDVEILSAIDNIAMQMNDSHRAVIIAPAAVLVEPLRRPDAARLRSDLLRSDRVRAVVRLPEGLVVSRPGQPMALWVLASAHADVKPVDRWTVIADLGATELDDQAIEGVVSDVSAAMGSWHSIRAHAFYFGVIAKTSVLLADDARGLKVRRQRDHRIRTSGAEAAGRVLELTDSLNVIGRRVSASVSVAVEYSESFSQNSVLVADLIARGEIKIVPGNRVDDSDIAGGGDIRVIGSDEVLARCKLGERTIDRLAFTHQNPSGRYTEPGDVVFCTSPAFGVLVDAEGSSVVIWPARILRVIDPCSSGLIPELVARYLISQQSGSRPTSAIRSGARWRSWMLPRVSPEDVHQALSTLEELRERRRAAVELIETIDTLTTTLADGVAHGALTVVSPNVQHTERG